MVVPIELYLHVTVLLLKQIKDKHAVYLDVSRLEKFFQALSLSEEKIFLKRFELRQVC